MKKLTASKIITWLLAGLLLLVLFNPGTRVWMQQGLMKLGFFKPNLENQTAPTAEANQADSLAIQPTIIFTDKDNNEIDMSAQTGKVVFINFWATWCPPCIAEMPSIEKLYAKFKSNDSVVFIIADVDKRMENAQKFMTDNKINLPVHIPATNIPSSWLGNSIPTTIILNKKGEIAMRHEGMADYGRPEVIDFINGLLAE